MNKIIKNKKILNKEKPSEIEIKIVKEMMTGDKEEELKKINEGWLEK
jgi:hypothetical protein